MASLFGHNRRSADSEAEDQSDLEEEEEAAGGSWGRPASLNERLAQQEAQIAELLDENLRWVGGCGAVRCGALRSRRPS